MPSTMINLIEQSLGRKLSEADKEAYWVLTLNKMNIYEMPKQDIEDLIAFIKAMGQDVSDKDL